MSKWTILAMSAIKGSMAVPMLPQANSIQVTARIIGQLHSRTSPSGNSQPTNKRNNPHSIPSGDDSCLSSRAASSALSLAHDSHATSRAKRCQSCCSCCDKDAEDHLPYTILLHVYLLSFLIIVLSLDSLRGSEGACAPSRLITRLRQCWADALPLRRS